jgi:hypothetical protein
MHTCDHCSKEVDKEDIITLGVPFFWEKACSWKCVIKLAKENKKAEREREYENSESESEPKPKTKKRKL